ncbi:hypothetical protein [Sinorhizobium meliloti]|uniref:hypothetical protein n=1 Tax=Rhizobium meliloti TaxID=382 RepID=UPI0023807F58|nr:hypothetical protein [Sinorhizobium meliloti]
MLSDGGGIISESGGDYFSELGGEIISESGGGLPRNLHKSLVFIECKATNAYSTVPDEQFSRWLQHNVPTLFQVAQNHPDWKNRKIRFEFWASAPLTAESAALYAAAKAEINANRYEIRVRLGDDIMELCEDIGDDAIR